MAGGSLCTYLTHLSRQLDSNSKVIEVNLTRSQIEKSPPIDTHKPVSRQHETAYFDYYGYPYYYWSGPYIWGPMAYPSFLPAASETATVAAQIEEAKERRPEDHHLRSAEEVTGYYMAPPMARSATSRILSLMMKAGRSVIW